MSATRPTLRQQLRSLWPQASAVDAREQWRAALGALLAVLLVGVLTHGLLGHGPQGAWLVAPMGATAVLLFAMPSSPLTQPWPVLGGSVLSALVGIAVARWVPELHLAAALAVGLAMGLMMLARCLHPPGGALALLAVLGQTRDFGFAIDPVLVNAVLVVGVASAYNTLTGKPYPHRAHARIPEPSSPVQPTAQDIDAALHQRGELVDVAPDDLQQLVQDVEARAFERALGEMRCQDIMSRQMVTVQPDEPLARARQRLHDAGVKALPVVDALGHVCGILTRADLSARSDGAQGPAESSIEVRQRMTQRVRMATTDTRLIDLLPLFATEGHHHLPVVDASNRLVGMVTQSDVVRTLAHTLPVRPPL